MNEELEQCLLDSNPDRDPVEELAESFVLRRRRGEVVSITDYAERNPELAPRIRDLFPTLMLMEDLKPSSASRVAREALGPLLPAGNGMIERFGDFHILREIGRGGMGVVYEAEQESLGRRVALKVLPAAYVASVSRLRRFLREAQAAARLHHTNIVPVFGVGEQDGIHYIVMQYIPGQGLDKVVAELNPDTASPITLALGDDATSPSAPLPHCEPLAGRAAAVKIGMADYWRHVARIGVQIADALDYAHRQGTLHRDIKPANLLLDHDGTVWIADFGLAKIDEVDDLTHSGDMVGTIRYMAPERFEGKVDARSDVYSLGLTLYELLTLHPAFDEPDRPQLIRQVTQGDPRRPRSLNSAIPIDLETIVLKAIAHDPGHRYQSAGELAADLQCFLDDRPVRARRTTPFGRLWRWCRRNRAVSALSGTSLALLVTVALMASIGYLRTDQALTRVSKEREQAEAARTAAEAERARTKAEHDRAEANLRLATKAFEDIFAKVSSDAVAEPPDAADSQADEDDGGAGSAVALEIGAPETQITDKDAAMLESMLKFYNQFAEQNYSDVKLQAETGRAYCRVGDIQRRLGQDEKSEVAYRHALNIYQQLAKSSPEGSGYMTAAAAIQNDLGEVYRETGHFAESRELHLQALATLGKQSPEAAARDESQFELARTYSLFTSDEAVGDAPWRRPRGDRRPRDGDAPLDITDNNARALAILTKLTAQSPNNPRYLLAVARSERDRFILASHEGKSQEAASARAESIRILEKLTVDSPTLPDYQFELAETLAMSARGPDHRRRDKNGKPASLVGAKPAASSTVDSDDSQLRRAIEIGNNLVNHYPTVPVYKASLARARNRLAENLLRSRGGDGPERVAQAPIALKSIAEAEAALDSAIDLQKGLVAEFPAVMSYRFGLIRSLDQLGKVEHGLHNPAKERTSLELAIETSSKIDPASPQGREVARMLSGDYTKLAQVLRELGDISRADEAAAKGITFNGRRRGVRPSTLHRAVPGTDGPTI